VAAFGFGTLFLQGRRLVFRRRGLLVVLIFLSGASNACVIPARSELFRIFMMGHRFIGIFLLEHSFIGCRFFRTYAALERPLHQSVNRPR
jgi:hypothetical protein